VDTKANPPLSIWTHPYENPAYLEAHPEVREKVSNDLKLPASEDPRRHSFNGASSSSDRPGLALRPTSSNPDSVEGKKKRSFLGKVKDKVVGTKEERELAKLVSYARSFADGRLTNHNHDRRSWRGSR
jgi:hypothetical protein